MQPNATVVAQSPIPPDRGMLEEVKKLVGSQTFDHWFLNKASIQISDNEVTIGVANPFLLNWMQHRFRPAVTEASGPDPSVNRPRFASDRIRWAAPHVEPPLAVSKPVPREEEPALPADRPRASEPRNPDAGELVRSGAEVKPHENRRRVRVPPAARSSSADNPNIPQAGRRAPLRRDRPLHRRPDGASPSGRFRRRLRQRIGADGRVADLRAARQPLQPARPVRRSGTGKTHLLEATYKRLRAGHPGLNVLFLSAEGFANYFTQRCATARCPAFASGFAASTCSSWMTSISSTASA